MRRLWGWILGMPAGVLMAALPHAYFSGHDRIQAVLVETIDQSHQQVDLALYELSSKPLVTALANADHRGVTVRLVLDKHLRHNAETQQLLQTLPHATVRYAGSRRGQTGRMHHKFMIIDHERVASGSYNWTQGAEHVNFEDMVIENEATVVAGFDAEFERLWAESSESRATVRQPYFHTWHPFTRKRRKR